MVWILLVTLTRGSQGLHAFQIELKTKEECFKAHEHVRNEFRSHYFTGLCLGKSKT